MNLGPYIQSQLPEPKQTLENCEIFEKLWTEEFDSLQQATSGQTDIVYPREWSQKDRYADIQPSVNRVRLSVEHPVFGDYINADLCADETGQPLILTQAPLRNTKVDFARMLLDQMVNLVLSLSSEPDDLDDYLNQVDYTDDNVLCVVESKELCTTILGHSLEVTKHLMKIKLGDSTRELTVLRVNNWKDRCMPERVGDLVDLLLECQRLVVATSPAVIHCMAGVGRTGVMAVAWRMLEALQLRRSLPLTTDCLLRIRQVRRHAVQTKIQYIGLQILRLHMLNRFQHLN